MKIALVDVPDDRYDTLFACLCEPGKEKEKTQAPSEQPEVEWDEQHAADAVAALGDFETRLLWRIADARGARVPLGELKRDLGLPGDAAPERDFSGLSGYCASDTESKSRPPQPVIAGGGEDEAWYWMDTHLGTLFRKALEDKVFPGAPAPGS